MKNSNNTSSTTSSKNQAPSTKQSGAANTNFKQSSIGCSENNDEKCPSNSIDIVPWMKIAIEEARVYGGKNEKIIDKRIREYHSKGGGAPGFGSGTAWCASFICWCLIQAGSSDIQTAASKDFANDKRFELSDPFLGAIVVFSDCSSDGTVFDSGHVSFVVGKSSDSKMYYCLGGNQNQMLKVSIYNCSGDIFKSLDGKRKARGFYKPKNFNIKNYKMETFKNISEANRKILELDVNSPDKDESTR